MDRLPTLSLAVLLLAGCDDGSTAAPAPSRVVAVAAEDEPASELCDRRFDGADAPALSWPELAEGDAAPAPRGPRWLNVWATWCAPCVEELPRLTAWEARLRDDGAPVELVFLSADASAEAVERFRGTHPETPETLRIADPAGLSEWVSAIGLDEGASLPIHVLSDGRGRVRCLRTGGVSEEDYAAARDAIRAL